MICGHGPTGPTTVFRLVHAKLQQLRGWTNVPNVPNPSRAYVCVRGRVSARAHARGIRSVMLGWLVKPSHHKGFKLDQPSIGGWVGWSA